jgi:hypothetical protein
LSLQHPRSDREPTQQAIAFKVGIAAKQAETQQATAQAQEISHKLDRAQVFQQDLQGVQADPSPKNVSALIMKYPEYAEQIKGGWDVKDKAAKDADLTQLGGIYSAAASGNWDLAHQQAQARVDAEKAAGTADPGDEQFLKSLEAAANGDSSAQKNVLAALGNAYCRRRWPGSLRQRLWRTQGRIHARCRGHPLRR